MKRVVLFSGGVDSSVLLAQSLSEGHDVVALSFDYGQAHLIELDYAATAACKLGVEQTVIKLPDMALPGYVGARSVVPGRNLVFISHAVREAVTRGFSEVAIAAHADDEADYPDCRAAFIHLLSSASEAAYGVRIIAPFLEKTKAQVVELGRSLRVDFAETWSCYNPQGLSECKECSACLLRSRSI